MNLPPDVEPLIDDCSKKRGEIDKEIRNCINRKEISSQLKILIKNYLENLKSCFDYMAVDIHRQVYGSHNKVHFPLYNENKNSFNSVMEKWFPKLKSKNPALFSFLEKNQYFKNTTTNAWTKDLSILTNKGKHENLSVLSKKKDGLVGFKAGNILIITKEMNVKEGGSFKLNGKKIPGGQKITPFTKNVKADPGIDIQQIVWEDIIFDEIQKPVSTTLQLIFSGTIMLIEDFKKI